MTRSRLEVCLLACSLLAWTDTARSAEPTVPDVEDWAIHGGATGVVQTHPTFRAAYSGVNSLQASPQTAETVDLTLSAGLRILRDAEIWINPELIQGSGLSGTQGVAGFPSGEAYKAGGSASYVRMSRAFMRYSLPLGGKTSDVEESELQLGGTITANNLITTVGKFSVVDIFDVNTYAHESQNDFLNWSVIDGGAFDYAADPFGMTYGVASELTIGRWTWRAGAFQLSSRPNSKIEGVQLANRMLVVEAEHRHRWLGRPGAVKLLVFSNRAPMASYADAVALATASGTLPDAGLVRRRGTNNGVVLNAEQELFTHVGSFLRVSANSGRKEAYEFTEINRSVSGGVSISGARWSRPEDHVGFAVAVNAISNDAKRYFAAGGTGIVIGDGHLKYGTERIFETNYVFNMTSWAHLSLDYQFITHPAYNADRGPVSIYGMRWHGEF